MPEAKIYTIVSTGVDVDRGLFPDPQAHGSYLDILRAREELDRLIEATKKELDERYDYEKRSEDHWEMCMMGSGNSLLSRLEILTSQLMYGTDTP